MIKTNSLRHFHKHLTNQTLVLVIKDVPFNEHSPPPSPPPWTSDAVTEVLRSIARYTLQSPRSIGRQNTFRHRTPLRQRNMNDEHRKLCNNTLVLGPAAHRDPHKAHLGPLKALEFFHWVEARFTFSHSEATCRELACLLARANLTKPLWNFLKHCGHVTTATVTCVIKLLGEEGLANEALLTFYRMKQFRCNPDTHSYNALIHALCRVGNFDKARFLLQQMELPGFRCSPDTFTYTILISSYCRHGVLTGCRKATRRRIYEAGRLFRLMLFKGLVPDVVTYNALIDGCCKTWRLERALELFDDMKKRGVVPNRVTYGSFIRYYSVVNEIDKGVEMLRDMQRLEHGVASSSLYTPVIHALCEAGRVVEAWGFLVEMVDGGSVPREYTYKLVCDALCAAGQVGLLDDDDGVHKKIKDGIWNRYRHLMKVKPIMARKGYPELEARV